MTDSNSPKVLLCDCLGSQELAADALAAATGLACAPAATALCTDQAARAAAAIKAGGALIACRQQAHVFADMAEDMAAPPPAFVDLRDRAGWSQDPRPKSPKMAALLADATITPAPIKTRDVVSAGLCLIIGKDETALISARRLADILTVTVLLAPGSDPGLGDETDFDIVYGRVVAATGALGDFQLTIDGLRERVPGGHGAPVFDTPRDDARTTCDLILDLSGAAPLFPASAHRAGYLRADPASLSAVMEAVFDASHLVGTFEKPLYLRVTPARCAHRRAGKIACTRCLDLCPTGALTAAGDHVAVDDMICAGCGACAAACPSAAISYDAPPAETVFHRLSAMAGAWRELADDLPRLLVHDGDHGAQLIRLLARHGTGLAADLIPLEVTAVAAFGHAEILAALGVGFSHVLLMPAPTTPVDGLPFEIDLANTVAGYAAAALITPSDPEALAAAAAVGDQPRTGATPILPLGSRRQVTRLAAQSLGPPDRIIDLPARAPYGAVEIDKDACTLCLSCAALCPAGALADNPERPQLRFQESACLQCGLCVEICPERALTLTPRLDLRDGALSHHVLLEEEPFACVECGALFGVRATITRMVETLAGKHSMFAHPDAARMIQMCENCRVTAAVHAQDNPFAGGARPPIRTAEDGDLGDDAAGGDGAA